MTASEMAVGLINGVPADNVFWEVGSSATLGTGSVFFGTIVADQDVTLNTGTSVTERTLALNGIGTIAEPLTDELRRG